MNIPDVVINIACGVAGTVIYASAVWAIRFYRERRGHYTGIWWGEILDANGTIEKRDEYDFRHVGDTIQGTIRRVFPSEQTHRRWKLYGRLRGRDFFAIFWSTDHSVLSYGCWYLHQVGDFDFDGYYLRISEGAGGVAVNPIKLRIRKRRTTSASNLPLPSPDAT